MSPTKKFSVWLTAIALLVAMVLTPIAAGAKPPASKVWNIYQDKLGAYTVTSAVPKGQTLVAGAYATQAEAQAILSTPPTVNYALTGTLGQNGWHVSDVALDWTVTDAPKVVPGYMQVTGNLHESITADQQATDYTVSATSVGGTTTKTATVARDATLPDIVWNSAIVEGDSFELGTVPPEPTIEASDATSGLDASSLAGYGTAVGAYQLTATATDLAGNMRQETLGYTVFAHPANVVDPTVTDETFNSPGVANPGSIVIPTVPGVDYYLDGVLTDGGSYPFYAGTHQVTAQAQSDYELNGYPTGGWTLVIAAADVTVHVTTVAPTKTDQTATAEGFITIPAVTGVNYFIDGVAAAGGDNPLAPGNYAVTAESLPFYILDGDTSWNLTINAYVPPIIEVDAVAPTATDQTANASGFITIPVVVGLAYAIEGTPASGNVDKVPGLYAVTAEALPGYHMNGYPDGGWSLTINAYVPPITEVTPAAPTATDQGNGVSGFITIPTSQGVDYYLDGELMAAGNYDRDPDTYAVVAQAQPRYALVGQTSWNLTINPYVPPKQVEFVGRTVGNQAGTSLALPEGWQPGDLAIVMVTRNASTLYPNIPAGYTGWSQATGGAGTSQGTSRLCYRVLQAGDTGPSWGTVTFRSALVMVYRNATPGVALGNGGTNLTVTFPGLTLQNNTGSSWVGGYAWSFTAMRDAAAPTGMVSRTFQGGGTGLSLPAGFDTNGGVTSFASRSIPAASQPWNSFSFELKVTP